MSESKSMAWAIMKSGSRLMMERLGLRGIYSKEFFDFQAEGSTRSANQVVPKLLELVPARSAIDLGSGICTWLAAFKKAGVDDVLGVDGDYVDRAALKIPKEQFRAHNLNTSFDAGRTFDVAMSVECAEHIEPASSDAFVDSLVRHAPVVMFSAAVPFQGGRRHINERWQHEWVEKFERRGYVALDPLRSQVWDNQDVEWWYAQNILVYVRKSELDKYPALVQADRERKMTVRSVVHPKCHLSAAQWGWSRKSFTNDYTPNGAPAAR